jgi:hypothetical protein
MPAAAVLVLAAALSAALPGFPDGGAGPARAQAQTGPAEAGDVFGDGPVEGVGVLVPLADAVRQIVPGDVPASVVPSLAARLVSWRGGPSWRTELATVAAGAGASVRVDPACCLVVAPEGPAAWRLRRGERIVEALGRWREAGGPRVVVIGSDGVIEGLVLAVEREYSGDPIDAYHQLGIDLRHRDIFEGRSGGLRLVLHEDGVLTLSLD